MSAQGALSRRQLACGLFLALAPLVSAAEAGGQDDALLRCAVRIRYERQQGADLVIGHGTAFGVDLTAWGYSGRKYLLSAAHNVLDDANRPFKTLKVELVQDRRDNWSPVEVLAYDTNLDLCLLESRDALPGQARLGEREAGLGAAVLLAGSPCGVPVELFRGVVSARFHQGSVRTLACLPFDHGDSGGPFFDAETGRLTGVAVAGVPKNGDLDKTVGLFVPLAGVTGFLDAHRRPGAPASAGELQVTDTYVRAVSEQTEKAQPRADAQRPARGANRPPVVCVDEVTEVIFIAAPAARRAAPYCP